MADMMTFPDTWEEFEEYYSITDREQIYTNGARLIPSFRVKQWLDHIADRPRGEWIEGKYDLMCSNCENTQEYEKFPYCPYCGAKMADRKTEPQTDIHDLTDCDFCKDRNCKDCEGGKTELQTCDTCKFADKEWYEEPCDRCGYMDRYEPKDEPQTEDLQDWKDRMWAEAVIASKTEPSAQEYEKWLFKEPQTEREGE